MIQLRSKNRSVIYDQGRLFHKFQRKKAGWTGLEELIRGEDLEIQKFLLSEESEKD